MGGQSDLSADLGNVAGDIFSFILPPTQGTSPGMDSEVPKATTDTGTGSASSKVPSAPISMTKVLKWAVIGAVVLALSLGGWAVYKAFKKG